MTHSLPLDWDAIDTVLLDMDGTLLDLYYDNYFWTEYLPKRYAEHHRIPRHQAQLQLEQQVKEREGTLQWYCLDHWSELVNMDIPALKAEISDRITTRPHTLRFLRFLRAQGKKAVLVTNAHRAGMDLKLRATHIDQWLDLLVSSHDFQRPKEDPLFWQALHTAEPFDPARTLFVDDTPRIVQKAAEFGIAHLLCITAPDSSLAPRQPCGQPFVYAADFDEVIPATFE